MGEEPGAISCREKGSCTERDPARMEGEGRGSIDKYFLRDYKRDISGHTDRLFALPSKCIAP